MLPPLVKALRALKVEGAAYLPNSHGRPFKSKDVLGNSVRTWCDAAGLETLSSHSVRKATAEWLAEGGCSQHQIMAIPSHTQAKTSEIYTKGAQRRILAADAMHAMAGIDWQVSRGLSETVPRTAIMLILLRFSMCVVPPERLELPTL